jgi:hypothetical protein
LKTTRRFGGTAQESSAFDFLLGLFFNPENKGDILPQSVGLFSRDYTALYPRRQVSS